MHAVGAAIGDAGVGWRLHARFPDRSLDLDVELCAAAWDLAQPHLRPDDGEIEDAVVGQAGGAAECHPVPCPEMIAATVYYRSGVEQNVILQIDGGLRVVDTSRVERATPIPVDGGKELPPRSE